MSKVLLLALALTTSAALAGPVKQYADLKSLSAGPAVATLTLDYVDLYSTDDQDARKVVQLGDYKTAEDFQDSNPSGLYIRNVSKKLRVLKTNPATVFEVVCLSDKNSVRTTSLSAFAKTVNGTPPAGCWPFGGVVELTLDGPRLLKVSQVYFP